MLMPAQASIKYIRLRYCSVFDAPVRNASSLQYHVRLADSQRSSQPTMDGVVGVLTIHLPAGCDVLRFAVLSDGDKVSAGPASCDPCDMGVFQPNSAT